MFFTMYNIIVDAGVAQLVVHLIRNQKVTCSSHATSSITHLVYAEWVFCCQKSIIIFNNKTEHKNYKEAIARAVEQGITNGTSETTFSPESTCTRGQIVTLLRRAAQKGLI